MPVERVLGVGGYFLRAQDPERLRAWYRDALGIEDGDDGLWPAAAGPLVFATFEVGTDYLGSPDQRTMLNLRVSDLDAMLDQLRSLGAEVDAGTQELDGVGRFGWVSDPEGNRVELWQPA